MMTPEQRYLFDVTGYLHLKNALSEEELKVGTRPQRMHTSTRLPKNSHPDLTPVKKISQTALPSRNP